MVVPLTSREKAEYDQVLILPPEGGLTNESVTLPDQMRAVDRLRLIRRLGELSSETLERLDRSLKIVLGLR